MITLRAWGALWFGRREAEGYRSAAGELGRWKVHVEPAELAGLPLDEVTRGMVLAWMTELVTRGSPRHGGAKLSRQSLRNILNLARCAFRDAIDAGHAIHNPFEGVRVRVRDGHIQDRWTVLTVKEQRELVTAMPYPERFILGVALGTGARAGELWGLELADVHLGGDAPHVVIRHGAYQKPTKSGQPRTVPLFGLALASMQRWIMVLSEYCAKNEKRLVFPMPDGRPRRKGHDVRGFLAARRVVTRHVRWHDLRHSCATALIEGWWGERWALVDVQKLLGHAALSTTERYVHRSNEALFQAAKRVTCTGESFGVP